MVKPWECSICHERFGSLFKGSIHARNHQGAPPAVIEYKLEGQPVKRCLQPDDESLASRAVQAEIDIACGLGSDDDWLLP